MQNDNFRVFKVIIYILYFIIFLFTEMEDIKNECKIK